MTCAFKRGLEMRAIIEDENAEDGVQLRVSFFFKKKILRVVLYFFLFFQSYCQNHSLNKKQKDIDDFDDDNGRKKHMTAEERSLARRQK